MRNLIQPLIKPQIQNIESKVNTPLSQAFADGIERQKRTVLKSLENQGLVDESRADLPPEPALLDPQWISARHWGWALTSMTMHLGASLIGTMPALMMPGVASRDQLIGFLVAQGVSTCVRNLSAVAYYYWRAVAECDVPLVLAERVGGLAGIATNRDAEHKIITVESKLNNVVGNSSCFINLIPDAVGAALTSVYALSSLPKQFSPALLAAALVNSSLSTALSLLTQTKIAAKSAQAGQIFRDHLPKVAAACGYGSEQDFINWVHQNTRNVYKTRDAHLLMHGVNVCDTMMTTLVSLASYWAAGWFSGSPWDQDKRVGVVTVLVAMTNLNSVFASIPRLHARYTYYAENSKVALNQLSGLADYDHLKDITFDKLVLVRGDSTLDARSLFRLVQSQTPGRYRLSGPSGSGKSSCLYLAKMLAGENACLMPQGLSRDARHSSGSSASATEVSFSWLKRISEASCPVLLVDSWRGILDPAEEASWDQILEALARTKTIIDVDDSVGSESVHADAQTESAVEMPDMLEIEDRSETLIDVDNDPRAEARALGVRWHKNQAAKIGQEYGLPVAEVTENSRQRRNILAIAPSHWAWVLGATGMNLSHGLVDALPTMLEPGINSSTGLRAYALSKAAGSLLGSGCAMSSTAWTAACGGDLGLVMGEHLGGEVSLLQKPNAAGESSTAYWNGHIMVDGMAGLITEVPSLVGNCSTIVQSLASLPMLGLVSPQVFGARLLGTAVRLVTSGWMEPKIAKRKAVVRQQYSNHLGALASICGAGDAQDFENWHETYIKNVNGERDAFMIEAGMNASLASVDAFTSFVGYYTAGWLGQGAWDESRRLTLMTVFASLGRLDLMTGRDIPRMIRKASTIRAQLVQSKQSLEELITRDHLQYVQMDALTIVGPKGAQTAQELAQICDSKTPGYYRLGGAKGKGKSSYLFFLKKLLGDEAILISEKATLDPEPSHADSSYGRRRISWLKRAQDYPVVLLDNWRAGLTDAVVKTWEAALQEMACSHTIVDSASLALDAE